MYCLYIMEKVPSIVILVCKIWKKSYCLFHILYDSVNSMENSKKFRPDPKLRLMDQVRQVLRYHHYAYRTENTYCDWTVRYIKYFGAKKHPRDMGKTEIDAYLSQKYKQYSQPFIAISIGHLGPAPSIHKLL